MCYKYDSLCTSIIYSIQVGYYITNLNRVERSDACYRAHRLSAKGCCFATAILAILHLVVYPILSCLLRVASLLGAAQPFMLVRRPY
jgi:hypothetical protein